MIRNVFRLRVRQDDGFAMITALLVIVVATFLGLTAVGLALHNQDGSAYDRARTISVHAAEAGLDVSFSTISSSSTTTAPCTVSGTTTTSPSATWTATISYYATYPPSGTALTCSSTTGLSGTPLAAVVNSVGSVKVVGGYVNRKMQSQMKLTPGYGPFGEAIFSEGSPSLSNQITVQGYQGNDADFYTNGSWTCPNNSTFQGSVIAQGSVSMSNSCYVAVDVWANGSISMANTATANHDAISSTSSLSMSNNSRVNRNVRVGTTCTGCTTGSSGRVGGTVTTSSPQSAPPTITYPTMTFDASAWTAAGWDIQYFTNCTTARTWLTTASNNGSKAVLRITGGCTLAFANNTTITRTADVAIFSDGPISTANNTSFTSGDGQFHDIYFIVQSGITCSGSSAGSPGTIVMNNLTSFSTLHFFVYAPCSVVFANNNSGSKGQIYGNPVSGANNFAFTYYPTSIPGVGTVTSFKPELSFVREVA